MRWDRKTSLKAGIALALAGTATAAAADILVVRATGPSATRYRPGSVLGEQQTVSLQAGDALVLLDEKGTWTLKGPSNQPARARMVKPSATMQPVSVNTRRARIGAVRSVEGSDMRPNIWLIDAAQPGEACIADVAAVTLWRFDTKPAGRMTIRGPAGASADVDWIAGQDTHAWPEGLPVVDGATYRLTMAGKGAVIIVKTLDRAPATVAETGAALIGRGCKVQFDLFAAQVEKAAS